MSSILIVDDSKTARMMLAHWIKTFRPNSKIYEAASGKEAIEVVKTISESEFTVVVDYNMPGMNGLELVSKLLLKVPAKNIALCTANIQETIRERAKGMGIFYIAKPVTPQKVKETIEVLKI